MTKTALAGIRREADAAGVTLETALKTCCERGWVGFKADCMKPQERGSQPANNSKYAGAAKAIWGDDESRTINA